MPKSNGGIIGVDNPPTDANPSGVWPLQEVNLAILGGNWPGAARIFDISPAVSGLTTWDLDVNGALNLSTAGTWTITTTAPFSASVKMWGGGAGYGFSSGANGDRQSSGRRS